MRTKEVYNNSIPMEYYEKLITGKKRASKIYILDSINSISRKEKTESYKCCDKEKIIKDREIFLSAHWDHDADN